MRAARTARWRVMSAEDQRLMGVMRIMMAGPSSLAKATDRRHRGPRLARSAESQLSSPGP
jgi:hypothetical protein